MNSNTFRMPTRRCAAVTAAAALAASPVAMAGPAQATGGGAEGRAGAVILRAGLEVSLLDKTVRVPLAASLNAVRAPATAERTTLSVQLDGVDGGRPFSMLRADVASTRATADKKRAEGYANLAHARVRLPGLPLLSLIEVEKATSKAVCETGSRPVAESNLLGTVKVLGKRVALTTGGPTRLQVPGVGEVTLDLSHTHTTSRTAAATALKLKVAVNPLSLNVAEVNGAVTLVEATCESPRAVAPRTPQEPAKAQPSESESESAPGLAAQSAGERPTENLAETGGDSGTKYLAIGAALLLALGGGAIALARGRAKARGRV
ncbi:LPXTG cell wall anchor domain-containing protein [Streptomyces inusitatus]|uniref:LPXTG cell wall anchor domain-containing protein n=1 Tax=Streptomyces inusitatus TaxID=68221 RepID=A0A918QEC0_9ACTN|nr:SCO1860 family LAETG-anchored protein [Streptomyces inusitatus]GGZ43967.1 LPXTG cell wall anchor domain-containing protein [Streptomyces inusitatus]